MATLGRSIMANIFHEFVLPKIYWYLILLLLKVSYFQVHVHEDNIEMKYSSPSD